MGWQDFLRLADGLSPWGAVASSYDTILKRKRDEEARNATEPLPEERGFWNMIDALK